VPRPRSAVRQIYEILRIVLTEGHSVQQAADRDDARLEAVLFGPVGATLGPDTPEARLGGRRVCHGW